MFWKIGVYAMLPAVAAYLAKLAVHQALALDSRSPLLHDTVGTLTFFGVFMGLNHLAQRLQAPKYLR